MPYTKTTWTDEIPASTPVKYEIVDDVLGEVAGSATIALVTSVTPGTALNATNLNKIETGIETAQAAAEAAIPKSLVTTVGDLIYATAAGILARLAKPATDAVLKMTSAGVPSWKPLTEFASSLIYRRQGGSSFAWNTSGTNNYTPTNPIIQVGTSQLQPTTASGSLYYGTVTVTFPVAFSQLPCVFVTLGSSQITWLDHIGAWDISTSQFKFTIVSETNLSTYTVFWQAIGEA